MDAIVILTGGEGSRVNKLLNDIEINTSKKKIIDFQINQLIKLKKKYFLSHVSFNSLKNYVNNNYSNKIKFEFIEEKNVQVQLVV